MSCSERGSLYFLVFCSTVGGWLTYSKFPLRDKNLYDFYVVCLFYVDKNRIYLFFLKGR